MDPHSANCTSGRMSGGADKTHKDSKDVPLLVTQRVGREKETEEEESDQESHSRAEAGRPGVRECWE